MKCISCEIEINPKWKHAIDINVCPFCGKHIMEEHLKNLLTDLASTMDQMIQYQDQLNDWMLSNHNYVKTDSPNLHLYMPKDMVKELAKEKEYEDFLARKNKPTTIKVKNENGEEEEVQVIKTQSEEKTDGFFARAEVNKKVDGNFKSLADKTQHLKNMVNQIKNSGAPVLTDESGGGGFLPAEMIDGADPEAVAEMQSMLSGGAEISSSLQDPGDDEEIPSVVTAISNMAKGNNIDSGARDLLRLQQMQNKARRNFEEGSSRGKGGFSRA